MPVFLKTQATALDEPPVPSISARLSVIVSFSFSEFSKPITSVLYPVSSPFPNINTIAGRNFFHYLVFFMQKRNHRFLIWYSNVEAF